MTVCEANTILELNEEEITYLTGLEDQIKKSKELTALLTRAREEIYDEKGNYTDIETRYTALVPDKAFNGMFYPLVGISNLHNTIAFYEKRGIPLSYMKDTLRDVALWIRHYRKYNGCFGFGCGYWISLGFSGSVFRIGRLEYEMVPLREPIEMDGLSQGDPVIETHIPQGEPLSIDDVHASYEHALVFFERYFNYHPRAFHLYTWMLDPALREILPPESNVLKFQREWTIIPKIGEGSNVGRFVFGMRDIDIKTAPRDTTLRRGILEYLEKGGKMEDHAGVILLS